MSAVDNNILEGFGLIMDEGTGLIVPNDSPRRSNDSEQGQVLRARRSLGNTVTAPKRKRARTFSESTIENHEAKADGKKQKLENKKAVSFFWITSILMKAAPAVLIRLMPSRPVEYHRHQCEKGYNRGSETALASSSPAFVSASPAVHKRPIR